MKPIGNESLDAEQQAVHSQLYAAVEIINEAKDLLVKNHGNEKAAMCSIGLSLVAMAKVLIVSKAVELNTVNRLPAFK
jgi:hypothetical protein